MISETVSYSAALIAGLLSFFSPCILPLVPAYFTFITGFTLEDLTGDRSSEIRTRVVISTLSYVLGFSNTSENPNTYERVEIRTRVVISTLSYVLGFSLVFVLFGASASYIGGLIFKYRGWIRVIGGALIILLGVHLTGLIRIRGLDFEKRIHLERKPLHFFGTFLVGMAFGAGWSPCIGPLLGSILIIAGSQQTVWQGVMLLSVYSLGLAIPFLIMSIFINFILTFMKKASRILRYVHVSAGILLIIVGLLLITDKLVFLSGF